MVYVTCDIDARVDTTLVVAGAIRTSEPGSNASTCRLQQCRLFRCALRYQMNPLEPTPGDFR